MNTSTMTIQPDDVVTFDCHRVVRGLVKKTRNVGTVVAVNASGSITVKDHCRGVWSCFMPEAFDVRVIGNRR